MINLPHHLRYYFFPWQRKIYRNWCIGLVIVALAALFWLGYAYVAKIHADAAVRAGVICITLDPDEQAALDKFRAARDAYNNLSPADKRIMGVMKP